MRNKWYRPYRIELNSKGTAATIRIRRRHPATLWYAARMVEPRELWRPIVWYAIVRCWWRLGQEATQ